MKKTIFSLIITLLITIALMGCGKYKEKEEIKVLAPMGTPALSQMYIENEKEAPTALWPARRRSLVMSLKSR